MRNDILQLEDLSKAMSDDPAPNDILRLDEMMLEASWIDSYRVAIYFYWYSLSFILLQIVGVTPRRSHAILNWFVCVASGFIVSGVQGSSLRVSASSCLS